MFKQQSTFFILFSLFTVNLKKVDFFPTLSTLPQVIDGRFFRRHPLIGWWLWKVSSRPIRWHGFVFWGAFEIYVRLQWKIRGGELKVEYQNGWCTGVVSITENRSRGTSGPSSNSVVYWNTTHCHLFLSQEKGRFDSK